MNQTVVTRNNSQNRKNLCSTDLISHCDSTQSLATPRRSKCTTEAAFVSPRLSEAAAVQPTLIVVSPQAPLAPSDIEAKRPSHCIDLSKFLTKNLKAEGGSRKLYKLASL